MGGEKFQGIDKGSSWIRVAGKNGMRKSTLLDLIAGLREADGGVREVGETAVIGYFTQYPPEVDEDLRLIDYIRWGGSLGVDMVELFWAGAHRQ